MHMYAKGKNATVQNVSGFYGHDRQINNNMMNKMLIKFKILIIHRRIGGRETNEKVDMFLFLFMFM